jgi:hypothetical protein
MDVRTSAPQFGARKERRSAAMGEALHQKSTIDGDANASTASTVGEGARVVETVTRAVVVDVEFENDIRPRSSSKRRLGESAIPPSLA